jgi:hypothetical protein
MCTVIQSHTNKLDSNQPLLPREEIPHIVVNIIVGNFLCWAKGGLERSVSTESVICALKLTSPRKKVFH